MLIFMSGFLCFQTLNHCWKNAGHKRAFVDNRFINTDPPHNMWKKKLILWKKIEFISTNLFPQVQTLIYIYCTY